MNPVILSPQFFYDPDVGRPISNGKIYVGLPGTDPKDPVNQDSLVIMQEDGSQVQVSQPIRTTVGGAPIYNGSPVTILTSLSSFSIRVDDANDVQKFYIPTVIFPAIGPTGPQGVKGDKGDQGDTGATGLPGSGVLDIGCSVPWNGLISAMPYGYLLEDGSAVSRTTYATLFAAIGTLWGAGDGSTTFNLPNSTDRMLIHADADSGGAHNTGEVSGTDSPILNNKVPTHSHSASASSSSNTTGAHTHAIPTGTASSLWGVTRTNQTYSGTVNSSSAGNHSHTISTSVTVNNNAGANWQPKYLAKAWIIRAF